MTIKSKKYISDPYIRDSFCTILAQVQKEVAQLYRPFWGYIERMHSTAGHVRPSTAIHF